MGKPTDIMKRTNQELLVGGFVLTGIIAIVGFASMAAAGLAFPGGTYPIVARFADVGGLKTGSPVRIAGVSVGRVGKISLEANFSAVVELRLRKDVNLPTDTRASIKTSGMVGDKYLALSPGAEERFIRPGEVLTETEGAMDMESLIRKFALGSLKGDPGSK